MQKKFTIHHLNKRKPLHVKGYEVKADDKEWKEKETLGHEYANRLQRGTLQQRTITR
jgi:hypothetical protein